MMKRANLMPRRLTAAAIGTLVALLSSMAFGATAQAAPPESIYQLINNNNRCLGIAGGNMTDGTPAVQWTCNGHVDQEWVVAPTNNGWYELVNQATYDNGDPTNWSCLGVAGGSLALGAIMVIWHCNGHLDQQWAPGPTASGAPSTITDRNSGMVIAVNGGGTADGLNIIQWYSGNTNDKLWTYL